MSFIEKDRNEYSPYIQLLMLISLAIAGMIVGSILSFAICFLMYGKELFTNYSSFVTGDPMYLNGLKIVQIFTTIGLFLVPPILLAVFQGKKIKNFYGLKSPKLNLLLIVLLIMIVSMPFMEWIVSINQKMTLPELFKPVESWMRRKEEEMMEVTVSLLTVHGKWDFVINIFMIALLPAVAEEFMFRGGLQRSFHRMFNNHHAAIWIAAFLFSAIHVQFFGFLPRLLLGAAFGYLYYWSGSLWYCVAAHFLNNAYAVCMALYFQNNHIPLNNTDSTAQFNWYGYVISFIGSILIFLYFKNKTADSNGQLD